MLSCNLIRKLTPTRIIDAGMGSYQETADLLWYSLKLASNEFSEDIMDWTIALQKSPLHI